MKRLGHPETPFPVGVEYYRVPTPKQECWDGDFARLSAAGFRIVRSASYWNAMEPRPGQYELADFDRFSTSPRSMGFRCGWTSCSPRTGPARSG